MKNYNIILDKINDLLIEYSEIYNINFTDSGFINTIDELVEVYRENKNINDVINQLYYIFTEAIPTGCRDSDLWTEEDEANEQKEILEQAITRNPSAAVISSRSL